MADRPVESPPASSSARPGQYTVIARRYRPQLFSDLIGQDHIAQALTNAIASDRVGHAYLFTGARGVGKTSTARILAKALNCQTNGPSPNPCNQCDVCRSISTGDDVDVLEIDGASNRGIDEIRQLRQNVSIRPSRSRFKIYIIDEVHMLTREAFNALLKTLEEPPEHVKFVFCTTEPTKVPATILSRCQRFDFAGVRRESIAECLRRIVESEGVEAEPEAIDLLARRAAGSIRDAQSLLEQLLAFAPGRISVADVHGMLGSAGEERLAAIVAHLVDRNAAGALAELDRAILEGVDVALLVEQLFGYFRDCMVAAVGCTPDAFLYASASSAEEIGRVVERFGLHTVLAAMQILDHTLGRLRYSTQGRILAELALVRIASLEELDDLPALISQLRNGPTPREAAIVQPVAGTARAVSRSAPRDVTSPLHSPGGSLPRRQDPANGREMGAAESSGSSHSQDAGPTQLPDMQCGSATEAADRGDARAAAAVALTADNAPQVWNAALARLSGLAARHARDYAAVATPAPNRLVISFKPAYTLSKSICQRPEQVARFEQALAEVTGQAIRVQFVLLEEGPPQVQTAPAVRTTSPQQRMLEVFRHPMVRRASELFDAKPIRVDEPPEQA